MTPADLAAWRKALGLGVGHACDATGASRRAWQQYERGQRPIPKTLALACAAVRHGLFEDDALRTKPLMETAGAKALADHVSRRLSDYERKT